MMATSSIEVFVRLRPTPPGAATSFSPSPPSSLSIRARASASSNALESHAFGALSGVLLPSATQEDVFRATASDLVRASVVEGISCSLFAYGQTGAGKTHSMVGGGGRGAASAAYAERGIIPRALSLAFALTAEEFTRVRAEGAPGSITVRLSFLEIIGGRIEDLLAPNRAGGVGGDGSGGVDSASSQLHAATAALPPPGGIGAPLSAAATAAAAASAASAAVHNNSIGGIGGGWGGGGLQVSEDKRGRPYVPGLLAPVVRDEGEALRLFFEGCATRALSEHALNASSTRGHAVLTLYFERAASLDGNTGPSLSRLHLIDLAGSERIKKSLSEGAAARDARHINSSLSALEAVVVALGEVADASREHVPFRSSKLTHLLKDALSGPGRTRMLAAVWPAEEHVDEGISTMRFAARCMRVRTALAREQQPQHSSDRGGGLGTEERAKFMSELALLRRELALFSALSTKSSFPSPPYVPLDASDVTRLRATLEAAVLEGSESGSLTLGSTTLPTVRHAETALSLLVDMCREARKKGGVKTPSHFTMRRSPAAAASAAADATMTLAPSSYSTSPSQHHQPCDERASSQPPPLATTRLMSEELLRPPLANAQGGSNSSSDIMAPMQPADAAGAKAAALDVWRIDAPEFVVYTSARERVRVNRAAIAADTAAVNEAKRAIERAMSELAEAQAAAAGGGGSAHADAAAAKLGAAKAAYRAAYERVTEGKREAMFCVAAAEAAATAVASAFERFWNRDHRGIESGDEGEPMV